MFKKKEVYIIIFNSLDQCFTKFMKTKYIYIKLTCICEALKYYVE